ncbi:hypothetical protein QBZ16_002741 [Prototheca wickerhamii]|uniref:Ribosome-recycling factor, chloroplastic n=1 Tax=Prototheca wickerhamii TaxID=3111 RepID=A0AAD9MNL6_PROWI|nr:hypothetical protein QBZ16_002741 [Prototheca wickerhamii]
MQFSANFRRSEPAVDYYGASTPIRQLATVTAPAADALLIQPYDPATIVLIEKALSHSDLGMTPTNDGRCIRLRLPTLTKERRRELSKVVNRLGEEGRVALRNVRREALKAVERQEKEGLLGEDDRRSLEAAVKKLMARHEGDLDKISKKKQQELLSV